MFYQVLIIACIFLILHFTGIFNNASARSAIEHFLAERKRPRALSIQLDRCFYQFKMGSMIILGYREELHVYDSIFGMTVFVALRGYMK